MSDIPGLAVTLAAQAALVSAFVRQRLNPARTPEALADSGKMIVLGAFLSALAIGMRSQAMWLTLPLLALVLVQRAGRGAAGALLGSAMTFTIGVLIWAVPLLVASGGPGPYRTAIAAQGAEDFAGVDMLYRNPGARRLAFALLETFIYPWASPVLGWTIFVLAVAGALTLLQRAPRAALLLGVLIGPYLFVHLLFHETVTTRYALPSDSRDGVSRGERSDSGDEVGDDRIRPRWQSLPCGVLLVTLPSIRVYAKEGSPAFAAISELRQRLQTEPACRNRMHQAFVRSTQTQNFGNDARAEGAADARVAGADGLSGGRAIPRRSGFLRSGTHRHRIDRPAEPDTRRPITSGVFHESGSSAVCGPMWSIWSVSIHRLVVRGRGMAPHAGDAEHVRTSPAH